MGCGTRFKAVREGGGGRVTESCHLGLSSIMFIEPTRVAAIYITSLT